MFEFPAFATGSDSLLEACIRAVKNGTTVIVGGGDTATLVANAGKEGELSHVSTGGGASLELLEGKVSLVGRCDTQMMIMVSEFARSGRAIGEEVDECLSVTMWTASAATQPYEPAHRAPLDAWSRLSSLFMIAPFKEETSVYRQV